MACEHRVAILVFDDVQSLDVSGPAEVLSTATIFLPDGEGYDVTIVSRHGGIVATQSAVSLSTVALADLPRGSIDTVIIAGGFGVRPLILDPDAVADVAALIGRADRLVTVCSGALLAAATGALDGHRVTTHWSRAANAGEVLAGRRGRRRPDLHQQRAAGPARRLVVGRRDRRHRPDVGARRARPLDRRRPSGRPPAGDVPAPSRRPVAVRRTDVDSSGARRPDPARRRNWSSTTRAPTTACANSPAGSA